MNVEKAAVAHHRNGHVSGLCCDDDRPHAEHAKLGDGRPCCGWPPSCNEGSDVVVNPEACGWCSTYVGGSGRCELTPCELSLPPAAVEGQSDV